MFAHYPIPGFGSLIINYVTYKNTGNEIVSRLAWGVYRI